MSYVDFDCRGSRGTTTSCVEALAAALVEMRGSGLAILVSGPPDKYDCRSHLFVLLPESHQYTIIRDGFASGYGGTGPAGLRQAIFLLNSWNWEISEIRVSQQVFEKICNGKITHEGFINLFDSQRRFPISEIFFQYVPRENLDCNDTRSPWEGLPINLPLPLFDRRLLDLVVNFWTDPDAVLTKGYRRLEDLVRARSGIEEHGAKLFSRAFGNDNSPLGWESNDGESRAYAQLFVSAFSAFRNARAHRELNSSEKELASELLLLNMLFNLESNLIDRAAPSANEGDI